MHEHQPREMYMVAVGFNKRREKVHVGNKWRCLCIDSCEDINSVRNGSFSFTKEILTENAQGL